MMVKSLTLFVVLSLADATSVGSSEGLNINPIRRVVTMLQKMQKQVAAEGEKEKEAFEKFMCYCKNGIGELEKSIKDAEERIPQIESEMGEAGAELQQLKIDIPQHKKDRDAAKQAMKEATALREKEATAFAKESTEYKENIDAAIKAIAALEKGAYGAFLQTSGAAVLRTYVSTADLDDADREVLTAFLT